MVVYVCDLSTQEAETGGSQVQGPPGLHSKSLTPKIKKEIKKKKRTKIKRWCKNQSVTFFLSLDLR
jgi:hypothetical protein